MFTSFQNQKFINVNKKNNKIVFDSIDNRKVLKQL